MKITTAATKAAWLSGDYVGERRPMVRATIAKWSIKRTQYYVNSRQSTTWQHGGGLRSSLFNQDGAIREFRNIKSIKWSRGVDTDVASMTMVLYNVMADPNRPNPDAYEFDFPGYYTPTRGGANPWNYTSNDWLNWLLPDRIIRTWEGYGIDPTKAPELDPNMYPSGVWLVDDVEFGTDGLITLSCRDLGRLLLDRIMFPSIIPFAAYPIYWEAHKNVGRASKRVPTGKWMRPTWEKDSNERFLAQQYVPTEDDAESLGYWPDGTARAVQANGEVHQHKGPDAFDSNPKTHWLSAGSQYVNPYEWVQGSMAPTTVTGVKVRVRGGPYRVYVSLGQGGKWLGGAKIPSDDRPDQPDMNSNVAYVHSFRVADEDDDGVFDLPRDYQNIDKIRFTFVSQWDSGIGQKRIYRAGAYELAYSQQSKKVPAKGTKVTGNYGDYTEIIKWFLAWGGWYWPKNAKVKRTDGIHTYAPTKQDPLFSPGGRVWGDLEDAQTVGLVKLDETMWDKKPLMDGINAVREITGFEFWIDETGGAIWRMPNVWKRGNYLAPKYLGDSARGRTPEVITIDERTTLVDLRTTLSSRNVRDRIFVADAAGKYGAVVHGYNPVHTSMKRTAGWTDTRFKNRHETRQMADLIAIRQSYLYRQNTITVAANPALQVDDQVVIVERLTGEKYLHRITSISSDFDYENGVWLYTLQTQWLGDAAFTKHAWRPQIAKSTRLYLQKMGKI